MNDRPLPQTKSTVPPTGPQSPLFSYPIFLGRMMGEDEIARKVLALFVQDIPNQVDALLAQIDRGDTEAVARSAHTIKGAMGNLGSRHAFELCLDIERSARHGPTEQLPELGRQLGSLFPRLLEEIRACLT
jgi:HPt (histidine-containing phosphotransfer) domain-containing protein